MYVCLHCIDNKRIFTGRVINVAAVVFVDAQLSIEHFTRYRTSESRQTLVVLYYMILAMKVFRSQKEGPFRYQYASSEDAR